jgi:hypothetical protein
MSIDNYILEEVEKCKDIIQLVDFDPKVNLPGTVTPGTVLNFYDDNTLFHAAYNKQLISAALYFDEKDVPIRKLVDLFFDETKKRELSLDKAKPLPHISWSHMFYRPVIIKTNIPARLICTWQYMYAANAITLDTIISNKTWREEKGLL